MLSGSVSLVAVAVVAPQVSMTSLPMQMHSVVDFTLCAKAFCDQQAACTPPQLKEHASCKLDCLTSSQLHAHHLQEGQGYSESPLQVVCSPELVALKCQYAR